MPEAGHLQRRRNMDGTRNVFCPRCNRYIGTVGGQLEGFGSAICAICFAAEEGEPVSQETYEALSSMTRLRDGSVVSVNLVNPVPAPDPMIGTKFRVGYFEYWRKVVSTKILAALQVVKLAIPESKKISAEKKAKRIFARMDIENELENKN